MCSIHLDPPPALVVCLTPHTVSVLTQICVPFVHSTVCCLSDAAHCFPYSHRSVFRLSLASLHLWPHHITRNSAPGVMKLTIFVELSLIIIFVYLVSLLYAQGYRRRFLEKYMANIATTVTQKPLPQGS